MSALYLMFNNLLGMGLGPILVSSLATGIDGDRNIGTALTIIASVAVVGSLCCYIFAVWRLGKAHPVAGTAPATTR